MEVPRRGWEVGCGGDERRESVIELPHPGLARPTSNKMAEVFRFSEDNADLRTAAQSKLSLNIEPAERSVSLWVRVFIFGFVSTFTFLALVLALRGETKAAGGALLVAALISPMLLEAWRPSVYILRKPDGDLPDTLINRVRQFRVDHPGTDGTIILTGLSLLVTGLLASMLLRLVEAFR